MPHVGNHTDKGAGCDNWYQILVRSAGAKVETPNSLRRAVNSEKRCEFVGIYLLIRSNRRSGCPPVRSHDGADQNRQTISTDAVGHHRDGGSGGHYGDRTHRDSLGS